MYFKPKFKINFQFQKQHGQPLFIRIENNEKTNQICAILLEYSRVATNYLHV